MHRFGGTHREVKRARILVHHLEENRCGRNLAGGRPVSLPSLIQLLAGELAFESRVDGGKSLKVLDPIFPARVAPCRFRPGDIRERRGSPAGC